MKKIPSHRLCFLFIVSVSACIALYESAVAQPSSPQPLTTAEVMRPKEILKNGDPGELLERCSWYKDKLATYVNTINEAAKKQNIPPQLLMAVLLNELADVGLEDDVAQDQQLAATKGDFSQYANRPSRYPVLHYKPLGKQSFGIAQINAETALKYKAVQVPGSERLPPDVVEFQIAYRLLDRTTSIHAAAKVIRGILTDIEKNPGSAWVKQFVRPGERFTADDPYRALYPAYKEKSLEAGLGREKSLAYLVVAIYNSGTPLLAAAPGKAPNAANLDKPGDFPNALWHANTSQVIATDLYESKLCALELAAWDPLESRQAAKSKTAAAGKPDKPEWLSDAEANAFIRELDVKYRQKWLKTWCPRPITNCAVLPLNVWGGLYNRAWWARTREKQGIVREIASCLDPYVMDTRMNGAERDAMIKKCYEDHPIPR